MKIVEFKKVADMLAKEHKITVSQGAGWAANIEKRTVFYRKDDVYNLPEDHILGLTLHEIAHIHYTTDIPHPKDNKELFHSTMNMVEDISIENIISGDYPNAGEILQSTQTEVLDTLIKILPTLKTSKHSKAILFAAIRFEKRGYANGMADYEKIGEKISKIMEKDRNLILNRKKTADLIPLINEIIKILIKEFGEPTVEEKRQMLKDGDNNEGSKCTENSGSKKEKINSLKSGTGWKKEQELKTHYCIQYVDVIIEQATKIGKQLRKVLKRNNAMEYGGRFRTGKIMAKRFVRILANKDRNPFSRRIVKSNQSYAFMIATDVSGSMQNRYSPSSLSCAMSSMQMVNEALRIASIKRGMVVFGDEAILISPISKTQNRWEETIQEDPIRKADQNGTNIGEAIAVCTKELKKVNAERKIMIILTDGSSDQYRIKIEYDNAKKENIECLAITIGSYSDEIESVFPKEKIKNIGKVSNAIEVGNIFIEILKQSIKKSS